MVPTNVHPSCLAISLTIFLFGAASAADDVVSFATGGYATGIRTKAFMHKVDTDHDGMISRAEWAAFQERVFAMLDDRKTGRINEKEFLRGGQPEVINFATIGYARGLMSDEMFKKIDVDGDGTLSHDEFLSYQLKIFDMMDTNTTHKGMLSQADLFATAGKDPR